MGTRSVGSFGFCFQSLPDFPLTSSYYSFKMPSAKVAAKKKSDTKAKKALGVKKTTKTKAAPKKKPAKKVVAKKPKAAKVSGAKPKSAPKKKVTKGGKKK